MQKRSAGLLMYRRSGSGVEVFLVHPGGPFWAKKDEGAWSIPKGEYNGDEDPLAAARREFEEETGFVPEGIFREIGELKQSGGKIVVAWAFEGDCDPAKVRSNLVEIEWPPKSGRKINIPEIDRAAFFTISEARQKINPAQVVFLNALKDQLERS